jgi:lysophospholipase L1-like esterase
MGMLQAVGTQAAEDEPGTRPATSGPALRAAPIPPAPVAPLVAETGFVSLSVDAVGSNAAAGGIISVEKPAGATVRGAYIAAASTGFTNYKIQDGDIVIGGAPITFDPLRTMQNGIDSINVWADVTSLVKPPIDSATAGRVSFTMTEPNGTSSIDGQILAVIFDDPNVTATSTIVLAYGAQQVTGDKIRLVRPPAVPSEDVQVRLGLGISYGFQPSSQDNTVDVNGVRLTSSAGGQDDGAGANGALITVGGLDDSPANPDDPFARGSAPTCPRCDDEYYNLDPFISTTTTTSELELTTTNPSADDNLFFAALEVVGATATWTPAGGRYVAFGDSYQSGEGADDYQAGTDADVGGNGCRRSNNAYPVLVAAEPDTPTVLDFVACSGARTWHMYEAQHPDQPPQFDFAQLDDSVELITIGIGGNDSGFASIIQECIFGFELLPFNDCAPDKEKTEEPVQDAFSRLRGEPVGPDAGGSPKTRPLAEVYADVRSMAPNARVLVVGYPQFFKSSGTLFFRCSGIKKGDQKWTNEKVKELNDLIKSEAERFGFEFVDVSPVFEGHRLCEIGGGESREWFRDIQLDFDWPPTDPSAFHPDSDGHAAMAGVVMEVFRDPPARFNLEQGQTVTFEEVVETLQDWLNFIINWLGSDVQMTITSPSGQVFDRDSLPAGANGFVGPTYEILQIPNPELGTWTIEIFGAELPAGGEAVRFVANQTESVNQNPVGAISFTRSGRTVQLDASASFDPDGDGIVEYLWFINDEEATIADLSGAEVEFTFDTFGGYGVTLQVIDARGGADFVAISAGIVIDPYQVEGPFPPLASDQVSTMRAGRTIPVKWRLTSEGEPVSHEGAVVALETYEVDCESYAELGDRQPAMSSSPLKNKGDGRWHFNWKTAKSDRGTCQALEVTFDDGSSLIVRVRLT